MAVLASIAELGPVCREQKRRADLIDHPRLNGIESVEYACRLEPPAHDLPTHDLPALARPVHVLIVRFLKPLPDSKHSGPDGAYGLIKQPSLVKVHGGSRVVGINVLTVERVGDHLEVTVDRSGDFSTYWLTLGWERSADGSWSLRANNLDQQFSKAPFSFKSGCPADLDCRVEKICPPEPTAEPAIDYLAKDYASFRQLLIDLIPRLNPKWRERNPADLGIALVELLAHEGDQLSYFQDAVANEAYLDTVRQRVSAKRHARLIDYRMHDGRNAWTYVHVAASTQGEIPQHTKLLTRLAVPLPGTVNVPGVVIDAADLPDEAFDREPSLQRAVVFETAFPLTVHPENNNILIHTWGNLECCLPRGTTSVYLYATDPLDAQKTIQKAIRPELQRGDFLLIEEVKGPVTGNAADADPMHRQVVRIVDTRDAKDAAYSDQLDGESLQVWASGNVLPLLQVFWDPVDALTFPVCVSARPSSPGGAPVVNATVVRGNMVLADHGRTVHEEIAWGDSDLPPDAPVRLRLTHGPITLQRQPDQVGYEIASSRRVLLTTARNDLAGGVRQTQPAVALRVDETSGADIWTAVPDLLDSAPFDRHFVVDVDQEGRATLRFGNDDYGQSPLAARGFGATYRIGNGRGGNIGAEALFHLVSPKTAQNWQGVNAVRNPLAATEGTDAETIEEVRQYAPAAFHAEQFRAVTAADYAAAVKKMPEVAGAVAMFRWTGSWYTVLVGVDPRNPEDLITEPGGRTRLAPEFERRVWAFMTRYRLAGYDLAIRAGRYVALELDLHVCVKVDHFRGDVAEAVRRALSNRINPDGSLGFFHPDHFTFGEPVYLSRMYAAVEAVPGVESLSVTCFRRYRERDNGELAAGVLPIGSWEIARLDNDPNFPENGVLRITMGGGK